MTDAPEKIWVWYEPEEDDAQWSEWPDDQVFEGYTFKGVYLLTPSDAISAREARDRQVREQALREAIERITSDARTVLDNVAEYEAKVICEKLRHMIEKDKTNDG